MAQNDPYIPGYQDIGGSNTVFFTGAGSSTDAAIINEVAGNVDVTMYIEESTDGGSTFEQITQLTDDSGNTTFSGQFHTQFNRIMVEVGKRRLRIDNNSGTAGQVSVTGDER